MKKMTTTAFVVLGITAGYAYVLFFLSQQVFSCDSGAFCATEAQAVLDNWFGDVRVGLARR